MRALEGIRVVELSIAIAAPTCGRNLAFHGAEVLKVESRLYPDILRLLGSGWARTEAHADTFIDTSPYLAEFASGKLSVGLELKQPAALDALKRLLSASDVFLTNYSTPAVRALGLAYEDVRAVRPDIIYAAMPGFGSDEALPYYEYVAWGPNQGPLVGLDLLTGYPDQDPCGIASIAVPDHMAGIHATLAVLAALEHRDATGEGCCIDLSQFELSIGLLGPFVMDHALTGHDQGRTGNRDPLAAPSGVYPCRGADRFVAITVDDDDAWSALGRVAGSPPWAVDPRFATAAGRARHHDELDELLAGWTAGHGADELAAWLQATGVAAHPLSDPPGVLADAQVRDRGWFQVRPAGRFARDLSSGQPVHLPDAPADLARGAPTLGQHTVEVLGRVGGMGDTEVERLLASGAAFGPVAPDVVLRRPYDAYLETFGLVGGEA